MCYSKETAFILQKLNETDPLDWALWTEAPPELSALATEIEKLRELDRERLREIVDRLNKFDEEVLDVWRKLESDHKAMDRWP